MDANFTLEDLFIQDYSQKITYNLYKELANKLQNYLIEGLKRKGFEIKNEVELVNFMKANCRIEDHVDKKERIYFVNNIPFFLHKYEPQIDLTPMVSDMCTKFSANYGSFAYL